MCCQSRSCQRELDVRKRVTDLGVAFVGKARHRLFDSVPQILDVLGTLEVEVSMDCDGEALLAERNGGEASEKLGVSNVHVHGGVLNQLARSETDTPIGAVIVPRAAERPKGLNLRHFSGRWRIRIERRLV